MHPLQEDLREEIPIAPEACRTLLPPEESPRDGQHPPADREGDSEKVAKHTVLLSLHLRVKCSCTEAIIFTDP
eukprot:4663032-Amphidinium_carterae.1